MSERSADERPRNEAPLRVEIGHLVVRGSLPAGGPDALAAPLATALGRTLDEGLAARAATAVARAVAGVDAVRGGGDGRA